MWLCLLYVAREQPDVSPALGLALGVLLAQLRKPANSSTFGLSGHIGLAPENNWCSKTTKR